MKKILYLALSVALAGWFSSCEPMTEKGDSPEIVSEDNFEATVTPIVVNGKNTNKVFCSTPVHGNVQWSDGVKTYASNADTLLLFVTGQQIITCTVMNQDGSTFTKEFPVKIDELHYAVDPTYGYLTGGNSKTWVWDDTFRADGRVWGNGARDSDTEPTWWGRDLTAANSIDLEDGYNNYGVNASMTFTFKGVKFSKVSGDGTKSETGTFDLDMTPDANNWAKGNLTINGTTILQGVSQNDNKKVVNTFKILYIDNSRMALAYNTDSNTYEAWFWLFKVKP